MSLETILSLAAPAIFGIVGFAVKLLRDILKEVAAINLKMEHMVTQKEFRDLTEEQSERLLRLEMRHN